VDTWIKSIEEAKKKCLQMEPKFGLIANLYPPQAINPFSVQPIATNNPFLKLKNEGDLSKLSSLWRTKRQSGSGLYDADEEDLYEFLLQFQDFRGDMINNIGNLTCVLTQTKELNEEGDINIDFYTSGLTETASELGFVFDEEGSAAKDPEFRQKMSEGYTECYKISQEWPQSSLDRKPLTRVFGRQMIFLRCAQKLERRRCSQFQMLEWLEKLYGSHTPEEIQEFKDKVDLPEDKFDAVVVKMAVLENAGTKEAKFIDEFFWPV